MGGGGTAGQKCNTLCHGQCVLVCLQQAAWWLQLQQHVCSLTSCCCLQQLKGSRPAISQCPAAGQQTAQRTISEQALVQDDSRVPGQHLQAAAKQASERVSGRWSGSLKGERLAPCFQEPAAEHGAAAQPCWKYHTIPTETAAASPSSVQTIKQCQSWAAVTTLRQHLPGKVVRAHLHATARLVIWSDLLRPANEIAVALQVWQALACGLCSRDRRRRCQR